MAPGESESINPSLVSKHFVAIDQWRQTIQLIISEAKKTEVGESMSGLVIDKEGETCMSLI